MSAGKTPCRNFFIVQYACAVKEGVYRPAYAITKNIEAKNFLSTTRLV